MKKGLVVLLILSLSSMRLFADDTQEQGRTTAAPSVQQPPAIQFFPSKGLF
jgi:hypothetical protein